MKANLVNLTKTKGKNASIEVQPIKRNYRKLQPVEQIKNKIENTTPVKVVTPIVQQLVKRVYNRKVTQPIVQSQPVKKSTIKRSLNIRLFAVNKQTESIIQKFTKKLDNLIGLSQELKGSLV